MLILASKRAYIALLGAKKGDIEKTQNPIMLFLMPKRALKTPIFEPVSFIFQYVIVARPPYPPC